MKTSQIEKWKATIEKILHTCLQMNGYDGTIRIQMKEGASLTKESCSFFMDSFQSLLEEDFWLAMHKNAKLLKMNDLDCFEVFLEELVITFQEESPFESPIEDIQVFMLKPYQELGRGDLEQLKQSLLQEMQQIDAQMEQVDIHLINVETKVVDVEAKVINVENKVTNIETKIEQVASNLSALEDLILESLVDKDQKIETAVTDLLKSQGYIAKPEIFYDQSIFKKFEELLKNAEKSLYIIAPWVYEDKLNLYKKYLSAAVRKNLTVGIDFGYISASNNSSKTSENEKNRENAGKLLQAYNKTLQNKLQLKIDDTHIKAVVVDEKYCFIGSCNLLSYRHNYDRYPDYRHETMVLLEDSVMAASLIDYFQSRPDYP